MEQIVIIGNGIAGITAARHIRKNSNAAITVISSDPPQFFSRTALMYVYMGHMTFEHTKPYEDWFWKKNRIGLVQDHVTQIDTENKLLQLKSLDPIPYDKLIIATGSKPTFHQWPGQELKGVQGLYHKGDLDLLEANAPNAQVCKRAVIVGGGLIGIELAEMLHSRHIPVTFLVRDQNFWEGVLPTQNAKLLNEHILSHGIDLRLNTELKEVVEGDHGRVKAIITNHNERIDCELVGITTGVQPNIDFIKTTPIKTDKGVLVNKYLETNIEGIYAIGDCAQQTELSGLRRPIEAVWYTGRMMGETLAQTICGNKRGYQPGHWFNSAKFFDVEYQTYGWVNTDHRKPEHEQHFHWKHPQEPIAITIAYHKETNELLGINSFGIRLRHPVLDAWLTQQKSLPYCLAHWADALFDPEFSTSHQKDLLAFYNTTFQKSLKPVKKSWASIFNPFSTNL
jgi:NAD(P)H-nitrite reductase large subunit